MLKEFMAILAVFVIFIGAVFVADYVRDTATPQMEEMTIEELSFYNMYAELGLENEGDAETNYGARFYLGDTIDKENTSDILVIDRSGTVLSSLYEEERDILWVHVPYLEANRTTLLYILPFENESLMPEEGERINYVY